MSSAPSSNLTDQELIDLINGGDHAAFETLYRRYRDWTIRLAWRFTGHEDDAHDVLQEVFTYLAKKFPGFRLSAAMTTFLYPAVRNLSIAARRKRSRSVSSDVELEFFESPAASAQPATELSVVFAGLTPAHREILLMRFVDDMSQPEIAAALDLPLGTVKSRLHHAILAARQLPNLSDHLSNDSGAR